MFRRLSGFSLLPLIGILTPFLLLPIVARIGGPDGWTAIGVGQSVGLIGGVLTLWGWWILGPARMSRLRDPSAKHALYIESLEQRGLILLVVSPIAVTASAIIVGPDWAFTAGLMAVAVSAGGLSPSWYSIGEGRPLQMVLFEDAPKATAMVLAAILVLFYRQIWIFPALLLLASVVFPVIFGLHLSRTTFKTRRPLRHTIRGIRLQAVVASTNLLGTSYTATPVPIASILLVPQVAAPFVSAEKIYRLGTFTVKALGNALQSWVIEGGIKRRQRHYFAIGAHGILGLAGGGTLAGLGPLATQILFGREVAADFRECIPFGLAFLFVSMSTPLTRNILVPAGRTKLVLFAASVSAAVGLPLMLILGILTGVAGVGFGLAASQALIFFILIVPAIKWLRGDAPLAVPGGTDLPAR